MIILEAIPKGDKLSPKFNVGGGGLTWNPDIFCICFAIKTKVSCMVKTNILSFLTTPLFAHLKEDRECIS